MTNLLDVLYVSDATNNSQYAANGYRLEGGSGRAEVFVGPPRMVRVSAVLELKGLEQTHGMNFLGFGLDSRLGVDRVGQHPRHATTTTSDVVMTVTAWSQATTTSIPCATNTYDFTSNGRVEVIYVHQQQLGWTGLPG